MSQGWIPSIMLCTVSKLVVQNQHLAVLPTCSHLSAQTVDRSDRTFRAGTHSVLDRTVRVHHVSLQKTIAQQLAHAVAYQHAFIAHRAEGVDAIATVRPQTHLR